MRRLDLHGTWEDSHTCEMQEFYRADEWRDGVSYRITEWTVVASPPLQVPGQVLQPLAVDGCYLKGPAGKMRLRLSAEIQGHPATVVSRLVYHQLEQHHTRRTEFLPQQSHHLCD